MVLVANGNCVTLMGLVIFNMTVSFMCSCSRASSSGPSISTVLPSSRMRPVLTRFEWLTLAARDAANSAVLDAVFRDERCQKSQ